MVGERGHVMAERGPRTGTPIQIWLPVQLKELLIELALKNRRKLTGEVILALENHLKASGVEYDPDAETAPAPAKKSKKK
jgi:hypothetical protein